VGAADRRPIPAARALAAGPGLSEPRCAPASLAADRRGSGPYNRSARLVAGRLPEAGGAEPAENETH